MPQDKLVDKVAETIYSHGRLPFSGTYATLREPRKEIYIRTAKQIIPIIQGEIKKELEELLLSYRIQVVADIIDSPDYKKYWQGGE